jgi:hypothetical protein
MNRPLAVAVALVVQAFVAHIVVAAAVTSIGLTRLTRDQGTRSGRQPEMAT